MSRTKAAPARADVQLTATELRFSYGDHVVLSGLDLTLSPGKRVGVVGENGSGKTTLVRLLSGTLPPDRGEVRRRGSCGVADQALPLPEDRTVGDLIDLELAAPRAALRELDRAAAELAEDVDGAEEAYSAALAEVDRLDAWDVDRRVGQSLAVMRADHPRDRTLSTLSVGQRYRIRLACLLDGGHDLLLLDEPTNHVDRAGIDHVTMRLREFSGGVLLVSHDRALLTDVVTDIVDLDPSEDGRPRTYGMGYAEYRHERAAARARWEQEHHRQVQERDRLAGQLTAAQDRLMDGWRPPKGTGKHTRSTRAPGVVRAVHRQRAALDAHAVTVPEPPLRLSFPELPSRGDGSVLVSAVEAEIAGRGVAPRSLTIHSGLKMVLCGENGTGKSTLLAMLAGQLIPDAGSVRPASGLRVGWLPQESRFDRGTRSAEQIHEQVVGALVTAGRLDDADAVPLAELGVLSDRDARRPVVELSVGQQRRLGLALALAGRPELLLLDEPTNHLSMGLVEELTEALCATSAAVVLATHDRQLLRDTECWSRLVLDADSR